MHYTNRRILYCTLPTLIVMYRFAGQPHKPNYAARNILELSDARFAV